MKQISRRLLAAALVGWLFPTLLAGQETLERTANLPGGWVAYPGLLYTDVQFRFSDRGGARAADPGFDLGLGLFPGWQVGARFAPGSPTRTARPTEWEFYGRSGPLTQAAGDPLDLAVTGGFNLAARSFDGELSATRWFGPLRLLGAARALSSAYDEGRARAAIAAGAVVHPLEGELPLAVTADVGTLLDRHAGERVAWSAGIQLGVAFSTHTLALFATNTASPTLQGTSRGDGTVRFGLDFTVPLPAGRLLSRYLPREEAAEAVTAEPEDAGRLLVADMRRYLFAPKQLEIAAGTTIEWTNSDAVVHTVNADDGSWASGGIAPGERWRARFDRPGLYAFHCGPHPFMTGLVIVR